MRQLKDDGLNHISAAFLPDGKRFVFSGTESGHGVRLYLEALDEGKAHPFSMEGVGSGILLSWDGEFVATHGPDQKIYVFPVGGGEPKAVPGIQPGEIATAWSGDGKSLFVLLRGQVPAQVYQVEIATGHRTFWKAMEPADSAGIDTIGRVSTSIDNRAYVYSYVRTLSDLYLVQGLQ